MSLILLGALEIGLIYGILAIGVYLTFRILNFPDLTVDGSFPIGAAVSATLIVNGIDPTISLVVAFFAGLAAGGVTAFLAVRFGILHLLAGILTMIAAFSINIRIMGRPNVPLIGEDTIFTKFSDLFPSLGIYSSLVLIFLISGTIFLIICRLLQSNLGLSIRACGINSRMNCAQGGNNDRCNFIGVMLSNAIVALAGGMFAQLSGFADVTSGIGAIIIGLASVILGTTIFNSRRIAIALLACVLGSILYRLAVALTLNTGIFGLKPSDLNLATAVLVTIALIAPKIKKRLRTYTQKGSAND